MSNTSLSGVCLPTNGPGTLVGRVWRPDVQGPSVVVVRDGWLEDITKQYPTMHDLCEEQEPAQTVQAITGERFVDLEVVLENTARDIHDPQQPWLLAPIDLQAVKACGVTFARSMVERVIEENASGDPVLAQHVRERVSARIGNSLNNITAGSQQAETVKQALIEEGLWSQYLEVGIGPDAEVFTKAQPLSAVGWGVPVGLHPISRWSNPEPEIVLVVDSRGAVKGATLGNDVNLRDIEGRSALLLGKAKDNNASCAVGPFIRLFDNTFGMKEVCAADVSLLVEGEDGFVLEGNSSMLEISRDPVELVSQTIGPHHQYPDGLVLFMGTMFAPIEDRDEPGQGFTHKIGDVVTISEPQLGALRNSVRLSTECPEWKFGAAALMRNLTLRGLL